MHQYTTMTNTEYDTYLSDCNDVDGFACCDCTGRVTRFELEHLLVVTDRFNSINFCNKDGAVACD
jgi:hypothetical protein